MSNGTNDDFLVENVEVLLVDEQRVSSAKNLVALCEANKRLVLLLIQLNAEEPTEQHASEHDEHRQSGF